MRATLLSGCVLLVTAVLVIVLSAGLSLDVESVALMGAATGAVLALVNDGTPGARVAGFLGGFVAAWIGYIVRAGFLPDTTAGHSLAVALVVLLCTLGAAFSRGHVPLWVTLLGAAAMAGSYEATYLEAPSQVLRTSTESSTSVLLAVALGFLAAALVAPGTRPARESDADAPAVEPTAPNAEAADGRKVKEATR
jgi:hypothetical protein